MASWRRTASTETQDELDTAVEVALGVAQRFLTETGWLAPFAVALDGAGQPQVLQAEGDDADEMLRGLRAQLAHDREAHLVVALVCEAVLDGTDVVQVLAEHADRGAPALVVSRPYVRRDGTTSYGARHEVEAERQFWDVP